MPYPALIACDSERSDPMHELFRQRYGTASGKSHDYGDELVQHYGKVGIGAVAAAAAITSKAQAADGHGMVVNSGKSRKRKDTPPGSGGARGGR
jgi:hypothetical protein